MPKRRTCWGSEHVAGCRPGRPRCAVMRQVRPSRRPCTCPEVHFPHRRGYCEGGGAARYAFGGGAPPMPDGDAWEPADPATEALAFFEWLAACRIDLPAEHA